MDRVGFVVWLTGLPGSGKTTIARILYQQLKEMDLKVELFDGDEVRMALSPDLGFEKKDRELQARRVAYLSKLMVRNGIIASLSNLTIPCIQGIRKKRNRKFYRSVCKNFNRNLFKERPQGTLQKST